MKTTHSNPTPLRQKFIQYLTLNRKAERTIHAYVGYIYDLARCTKRSPELLGPEDLHGWLYGLITERKLSPSTVNLAINALRAFYGGFLRREIEPLLSQIQRPKRPALVPRPYSIGEIERLLTVGTEGNLRARAFLMTVYGGGLRLSEATHIQIKDLDLKFGHLATRLSRERAVRGLGGRCSNHHFGGRRVLACGKWDWALGQLTTQQSY